jgi:hypothetical protein
MQNNNGLSWSFYQIANDAATRPDRETRARDYLWATDLGNAPVDVYLKMMGEVPTNPPNARSMRKFHAGDIWEFYAYLVLYFAGVLKSNQDHLAYQYPGLLKVTGRQDFLAGGVGDWQKARAAIAMFPMTDPIKDYFERMVTLFENTYGNKELKEIVIETKSVGSFMWPRYEKTGKPSLAHQVQIYHYLKAQNKPEGHVAYISKDDSLMLEFGVFNPDPTIEAEYKSRIELLTGYYNRKEQPPIEKEIIFDEDTLSFNKNWKIEYSPYLTKLYGYSEPEAYYNMWQPKAAQFNRVFKRVLQNKLGKTTPTGKPILITKDNAAVIEEITAYFPNFEALVQKAVNEAKTDPALLEEQKESEI